MKFRVNGEVVPVHAVIAYRENRGTVPLILKLSTIWRSAVSFTSIE
jgi:hypothetical protein